MSNSQNNLQRCQRVHLKQLGLKRELYFSKVFAKEDETLIVHPEYLRRMGCGQIDFAIIKKGYGIIFELKGQKSVGYKQRQRLIFSANVLGELLQRSFLIKTVRFKINSARSFDII